MQDLDAELRKSPATTIRVEMPEVVAAIRDLIAVLTRGNDTSTRMEIDMSQLDDQVNQLVQTAQSQTDAITALEGVINGIPQIMQSAVDEAIAAGASQQDLQAVTDAIETIQSNTARIQQAVAAGTQLQTSSGGTATTGTGTPGAAGSNVSNGGTVASG